MVFEGGGGTRRLRLADLYREAGIEKDDLDTKVVRLLETARDELHAVVRLLHYNLERENSAMRKMLD